MKFRLPTPKLKIDEVEPLDPEMCEFESRQDCFNAKGRIDCPKTHYFKFLQPHTEQKLGFCQNKILSERCFNTLCKYIHLKKEP